MTAIQLGYWQMQEDKRHNLATETETNRSNIAKETETHRSNVANETENQRHNLATESETRRHNITTENETARSNFANEQIKRDQLNETIRSNKANEHIKIDQLSETRKHNRVTENIERSKANEVARSNKANEAIKSIEAQIKRDQLDETIDEHQARRILDTAIAQGTINKQMADIALADAQTTSTKHKTWRDWISLITVDMPKAASSVMNAIGGFMGG